MNEVQGSVGDHGDNLTADVRLVQHLLNRQNLGPLRTLAEDGRNGPAAVEAIRHARTRFLSMSSPDGRVDPRVKETAVTPRVIDSLLPHLGGLRARIIGGFLSDSDQFRKVNYHRE